MFGRFTENARRVVFFARYEASQYGSPFIETEHLLLGLLREDKPLTYRLAVSNDSIEAIRSEVEASITTRERISTLVEMPLSKDCGKALKFAMEESDRLGHPKIETGHLLLGMLMVQGSLAAKILSKTGIKPEKVREHLGTFYSGQGVTAQPRPSGIGIETLNAFLARLNDSSVDDLIPYFAKTVQIVDCKGRRWEGIDEVERQFEALFTHYAKKNVGHRVDKIDSGPNATLLASILWENITVGGESKRAIHRMTIILAKEGVSWLIFFVQVTPVHGY